MGKAILGQRFSGAIVVGIMCLGAVMAEDLPPSASALEKLAQAEFAKAGDAVRERLAREAAGDSIGAAFAARPCAASTPGGRKGTGASPSG